MVESIIGCKWSLTVLSLVAKLVRFDILDKTSVPEVPPRVEYDLTAFGRHFITLIDQVDQLQQTLERTSVQRSGNAKSR